MIKYINFLFTESSLTNKKISYLNLIDELKIVNNLMILGYV